MTLAEDGANRLPRSPPPAVALVAAVVLVVADAAPFAPWDWDGPPCPASRRYVAARAAARGGPGVCVKAYSSVGNWLMTLDDATKVAYGVDAMLWIDLEGFAGFRRAVAPAAVPWNASCDARPAATRALETFSYGDGWIALGRDPPETAATRGGYLFRLLGRPTRSTGPARGSWAQFRALLRGELAPAYAKPSTVRDAVRDFRAAAGFHQVDRRTDDAHCRFNTFFARTATLRAELDRRRDALGQARRYAAVHVRSAFGENPVYVRGPLTQERLHAREPPLHLCLAYLRRAADATACLRSAPGVAPASVFVASNSPAVERACARLGAGVLAVSAADAHRSRHTDGAGAALELHALVSFFSSSTPRFSSPATRASRASRSWPQQNIAQACRVRRARAWDDSDRFVEPSLAVDAWFAPGARPRERVCADVTLRPRRRGGSKNGAPLAFPWGQPGAVAAEGLLAPRRRAPARRRRMDTTTSSRTLRRPSSDLHQWAHAPLGGRAQPDRSSRCPEARVSCADASGAARHSFSDRAEACRVLPRPSSRAWIWDDPAFCTRRGSSRRSRATLAPWRTPASRERRRRRRRRRGAGARDAYRTAGVLADANGVFFRPERRSSRPGCARCLHVGKSPAQGCRPRAQGGARDLQARRRAEGSDNCSHPPGTARNSCSRRLHTTACLWRFGGLLAYHPSTTRSRRDRVVAEK